MHNKSRLDIIRYPEELRLYDELRRSLAAETIYSLIAKTGGMASVRDDSLAPVEQLTGKLNISLHHEAKFIEYLFLLAAGYYLMISRAVGGQQPCRLCNRPDHPLTRVVPSCSKIVLEL